MWAIPTAAGETRENTLNDLLDDIEAVRAYAKGGALDGLRPWVGCDAGACLWFEVPWSVSQDGPEQPFFGAFWDIRWRLVMGLPVLPDAWKEFMSQAHSHKPEEVLADYSASAECQ